MGNTRYYEKGTPAKLGSGVIPLEKTTNPTILRVPENHVHKTLVKSIFNNNRVSRVTVVGRNIGANGITIKSSNNIKREMLKY